LGRTLGIHLLILHIGTHKTGTSALQRFLGSRAEDLDRRGIHYLRSGRAAGKAHHELSWAIRAHKGAELSAWDGAREELAANGTSTQVISSEAFWFTDPAPVKEQLGAAADNVSIVMYLRRQDKYLQSLYKQTLVSGRRLSFAQWREKFHFRGDYLSVVRRWADAFGKDRLEIRPYERAGATIDIVAEFMDRLGIDVAREFQRTKAGHNNPSPRRELMELFRVFNQLDVDIDRDKFFYHVIRRREAYVRTADILDYQQCVALMADFADGNRKLMEEFYIGNDPLFPEMKPGDPPAIWPFDSDEHFAMQVDFLDAVWQFATNPERGERNSMRTRKKGTKKKKHKSGDGVHA
jgi:hypothetical protein